MPGCDGLKTGFTTQSGYSIAVTATRNGKRVIVIVLDCEDMTTRDAREIRGAFDFVGSCSTGDPIDDLRRLGLIDHT